VTKLADVATIVDCEHKTAPISEHGSYFAVGTPAMRGNVIDFSEARPIDRDTFDAWTRRLRPNAGDVLFAREAPVGPAVRIPQSENVAPGQRTVLIRADPARVDSRYLYYKVVSPQFQAAVEAVSAGSTVPHLNVADVRSMDLGELPMMAEQVAIGEILGALDDKVALNRRIIEASVSLAMQIVGREAVGPSLPLSDIAEIQMGSSPRGADLNEDGEGMEFYQGVRDFGELSPTPRVFAAVTPRRAMASDTLLAVRAPVGEVNWVRNETCIGRGLAAVRSAGAPTTVHYLLRRFTNRWDEHEGSGTVFSSVTGPQVKEMRFPTIPEASAGEVERRLASVHHRALSAEAESEVFSRTRDELLPLLMNGRITVKDAEQAAEAVL